MDVQSCKDWGKSKKIFTLGWSDRLMDLAAFEQTLCYCCVIVECRSCSLNSAGMKKGWSKASSIFSEVDERVSVTKRGGRRFNENG